MLQETQEQGANYQRVSLVRFCSLALFISTEAYVRSVSKPVVLVSDNRNQQIQNIFRPAHSSSLYHHLKPSQIPSFESSICLIWNKSRTAN